MIGVTGINAYVARTIKQRERIKQRATDFVKQKTVAVLRDLVANSPQWSGDLAASWTVKTSGFSPIMGYSPLKLETSSVAAFQNDPRFKGDKRAYQIALAVNDSIIRGLRWNSNISIINTSPTAEKLASGEIAEASLRQGNFIPGDVLAIKYTLNKHKFGSTL